ncbi:MAG: NAD(P)H-binding protein [Apibacter sp.]|uniref:NAD(P)H-binding protein n=1 Tax=Apibacter sp. TaxID=2023709 RepID=UPI0025FB3935|nr:NAD(P)H-binding protein [Apibacter sp.]MCT6869832.1 NAD(P)H-binding protein [Apibacter sp.]
MKKVIIIGATGSLAKFVINAISSIDGISLTLFMRNRQKLHNSENVIVIEGDAMNYEEVRKAISGQDIVYLNLAADLEPMTKNIVRAMRENNVNRIIAISSIGIYDSPLKSVLKPYRKLADIIEKSGLIYTILRPDWFTNVDEVDYTITYKGEPETGTSISRRSIAAFIAKIIENTELYKNENLGISKPTVKK